MRFKATLFILGLSLTGCSSTDSSDAAPAECNWPIEPVLEPRMGPGRVASPFPSDLYLKTAETATGYQNNITAQGVLFQDLVNERDGWAPHGPIRIVFSGAVTIASLPTTVTASTEAAAAIQLIDATTLTRMPFRLQMGTDTRRVYIVPFRPLLEERRYVIVVRKSVRPATGECTARNSDFGRIVNGKNVPGYPQHVIDSMRTVYALLKEGESQTGVPARDIALAVPYTTLSVTRELIQKRKQVIAAPITGFTFKSYPALMTDGSFNPELEAFFPELPSDLKFGVDARLDSIDRIVIGHFNSADYRSECHIPYGVYLWVNEIQCEETLEFLLTLPKLSRIRPEYKANVLANNAFPVVIFGHGLTACKETGLAVANTFAEYGMATIGIDVVEHGTRNHSDPGDSCGNTILEGLRILRFVHVDIARDNLRQSVLDQMQLVQMMASNPGMDYLPDTTAVDTLPYLQTEKFGYIGQSLGGMMGTMLTAIEPRVTTSVLNVPGGGMADFVVAVDEDAQKPGDVEWPDGYLFENLAAIQVIFGPADPLYYAPYAVWATPTTLKKGLQKNILLQQGTEDEVMPAYLTQNLARAMKGVQMEPVQYPTEGLPVVKAPYKGEGDVTVALQQFYVKPRPEGDPKKDWDAHYMLSVANYPELVTAVQEQAARFLWTGLIEGKSEVIFDYSITPE